ncbi:RNA-binding Raly-like protein isoform X1 [Salvelinus fontinalis]|uniref:RNA-binding Raly-like protein isoform X1 n=2 Tax=Salvelinus fontinalis TaxID=8038 RepID=UPI0024857605|nr:RNA-binding Raly-like protein isoform X1 [Salvelinus fontinalis]
MTLFKSEYHSLRHRTMTGELRTSRPKAGTKRASSEAYRSDYDLEYDSYPDDLYGRVIDYQRISASVMPVPVEHSPMKHSRDPSFSSGLHRSRDRPQDKRSAQRTGSSRAKLKMAELLAIKRELTQIKVQIDGLLDSVDKMDRQRKDHSDSPPTQEGSVSDSVSSLEDSPVSLLHRQRESPEPGEASDDDQHLQHYQRHCRINNHQSDLEDDM